MIFCVHFNRIAFIYFGVENFTQFPCFWVLDFSRPFASFLFYHKHNEIEYQYRLMFDNRTISVMAYNLYTILAEKLETILIRGVGNTRGRDYYDVYLLLSLNRETLQRSELIHAIREKATERGSATAIDDHAKILNDITKSPDIAKIWDGYKKRYSYAKGIALPDILALIAWIFKP